MYYPYGDRHVEPEIALKYALKLILIKCIFEFLINIAPPASNSVYDRERNVFFCTVVQWARSCFHGHMKRVRLPVTLISVTLYRSFFLFSFCFLMLIFFLSCFPDLYSYCWPCWSCTWIMKIYILSLSPESFILEKGFQELLICILATLTARKKKKKNISWNSCILSWC